MPNFTKDKWQWHVEVAFAGADIVDKDDEVVASVYGYCPRSYRVIAAAPEMYRILRNIRGQLCEVDLDTDTEDDIHMILAYIDGKETHHD